MILKVIEQPLELKTQPKVELPRQNQFRQAFYTSFARTNVHIAVRAHFSKTKAKILTSRSFSKRLSSKQAQRRAINSNQLSKIQHSVQKTSFLSLEVVKTPLSLRAYILTKNVVFAYTNFFELKIQLKVSLYRPKIMPKQLIRRAKTIFKIHKTPVF